MAIVVAGLVFSLTLAACGGSSVPRTTSTGASDVDVAFLQQMLPHHERAIQIAQLATTRAENASVRAFASRIVAEQTPELHRMQAMALSVAVDPGVGAMTADGRVTDDQLAALKSATGEDFDRMFVTLSIASEQGAVVMAQPEITGGRVPAAVALANAINSAPSGEIPQLQALLADLP